MVYWGEKRGMNMINTLSLWRKYQVNFDDLVSDEFEIVRRMLEGVVQSTPMLVILMYFDINEINKNGGHFWRFSFRKYFVDFDYANYFPVLSNEKKKKE